MLHEVFDPVGAAAQVPLQVLSHHSPANSRTVANGGVGILGQGERHRMNVGLPGLKTSQSNNGRDTAARPPSV